MADVDATDNHIGRPTTALHVFEFGSNGPNSTKLCKKCGLDINSIVHVRDSVKAEVKKEETIAEEASRIVYGDREKAYDDPNVNFEKIAYMWTGLFLRKLKPNYSISPEEVALAFVLLKVSRESHKPQRDNRVDMIGYVLCGDRIVQKREQGERAGTDGYDAAE